MAQATRTAGASPAEEGDFWDGIDRPVTENGFVEAKVLPPRREPVESRTA